MMRWIVMAALLAAAPLWAADWEVLTDVDNLDAWSSIRGEWSIEDGVITGTVGKEENAFLIYEGGTFTDFELECEWRTPEPTNGGVQFRSHRRPRMPLKEGETVETAPTLVYGYQANVETRQRTGSGKLIDEGGRGTLAETPMKAAKTLKQRDWNRMRIVAKNDVIEVYLHDELAHRTEDDKFLSGVIGIQAYAMGQEAAEVQYRNISVRELDSELSWQPIFNGEDFAGWKKWGEEEWAVEDGAIIGRSGPKKSEGYLATEETWKDFRVRGMFKMLGEGNFGLFYHSTIKLREKDGYPLISGVQGEVTPDYPGTTGGLYESYKRGWIAKPELDTMEAVALKPGEWNTIEIQSIGSHVKTWVNGIRVVDFDDPEPNLFEGSFALQLHAGGVDGITWKELYAVENLK